MPYAYCGLRWGISRAAAHSAMRKGAPMLNERSDESSLEWDVDLGHGVRQHSRLAFSCDALVSIELTLTRRFGAPTLRAVFQDVVQAFAETNGEPERDATVDGRWMEAVWPTDERGRLRIEMKSGCVEIRLSSGGTSINEPSGFSDVSTAQLFASTQRRGLLA